MPSRQKLLNVLAAVAVLLIFVMAVLVADLAINGPY